MQGVVEMEAHVGYVGAQILVERTGSPSMPSAGSI